MELYKTVPKRSISVGRVDVVAVRWGGEGMIRLKHPPAVFMDEDKTLRTRENCKGMEPVSHFRNLSVEK